MKSLLITILLLSGLQSFAQLNSDKNFSIFPYPVLYYTPETRLAYGAAATVTFRFKNESINSRPSNFTLGAAYTQNKQFLIYLPFRIFFNDDRYYIFGELGYYKYSYFFYGTGESEVPEELYDVDFPRIILNGTRMIAPSLYAGVRYHFESYDIKDVKAGGALDVGDVPGSDGSVVSGTGTQLLLDTRDSVFYPNEGTFTRLYFTNYGSMWGGDKNFNNVTLDASLYHSLNKNIVLAFNSFNSFAFGDVPFQQLPAVGGSRVLRGYYEGRFRDNHLMTVQAESRFRIVGRLGAAVFAGIGALGNKDEFLRIDELKYSAGAGLRFTINRKDHLNVRLDYALGPNTSGIYITIGEAF